MCTIAKIATDLLQRNCSPSEIPFETTASGGLFHQQIVGQERALDAIKFGIGIRHHGYNMVAIGPDGIGKSSILRKILTDQALREITPSDWCYVHNFSAPQQPKLLELPPGTGIRLEHDMLRTVSELREELRAAFEGEEYQARKQSLSDALKKRQQTKINEAQQKAREQNVAIVETESGMGVAPLYHNTIIDPQRFHELPEEEQQKLHEALNSVSNEVQSMFRQFNEWRRENQENLKSLQREIAASIAKKVLDSTRAGYMDIECLHDYFAEIELDVIDSVDEFLEGSTHSVEATLRRALHQDHQDGVSFRRYQINVMVDRSNHQGVPVIYEDHPSYTNLIGKIEHDTQFGTLVTNFLLIKPGALHRASGGYLILDAINVLQQPFAWDALKRTLKSGQIRLETLGQAIGLMPTISLEPEPIPLKDTKIVLLCPRFLYYLIASIDQDFLELFKVLIDFEDTVERSPEFKALYANLIATIIRNEGLKQFDRNAVARLIDYASRLAGDSEQLSVNMRGLSDIIKESDYWGSCAKRALVTREDVEKAIQTKLKRSSRVSFKLLEAIKRGDILISTSGETIGQVNGLSVFQLGKESFGHPTRITARTRLGKGEVIDIEREVALGGPIHSKGVLILSGFVGARYASHIPLSLSATLVFEQSYGSVEGDSASLAELCALLSSLAEAPVKQSLAVTGSVNQQGFVQSVGGINEKIEGFFDVCSEQGLTGNQGVIIPKSNIKNLMLRQDVVAMIAQSRFHIYAVEEVDDALELLTGISAGRRDASGLFPIKSMNHRIETSLIQFAEKAKQFSAKSETKSH